MKLTMTTSLSHLTPPVAFKFSDDLSYFHNPQRLCKLRRRRLNLYLVIQSQFITGHAANAPIVTWGFCQHALYVHRFHSNLSLATFIQEGALSGRYLQRSDGTLPLIITGSTGTLLLAGHLFGATVSDKVFHEIRKVQN